MKLLHKAFKKIVLLPILLLLVSCTSTQTTLAKDSAKQGDEKWKAEGYSVSETKVSEHSAYQPLRNVLVDALDTEMLAKIKVAFPDITFVSAAAQTQPSDTFDAALLLCGFNDSLDKVPNAVWIHTYLAGVDSCIESPMMSQLTARDKGVILTNSSGTAAPIIAEHTIAMMLTLSRGLHRFRDEQAQSEWNRGLAGEGVTNVINGKTMLVLGLGSIGQEVAERANALGMRVLATRNSSREGPDYVEYVGLSDETLTLAAQADVIVNALPLTDSTKGFVDAKFFETMRDSAFYISVGRGGTTDTEALISALESNSIAGAGLDVTDPEPLPSDHPLWKQINVIITPHLSGTGGESLGKILDLALENIRRFQVGEPLLNTVDTQLGY